MGIREDIVSSGVSFLQDPNVVSSSTESKISFLRSKNLTQEEIDAVFARASGASPPSSSPSTSAVISSPSQQHPYHPSQYQQPPPPYGWQPPPPELPKRDWRDWFIMATVVGGVGYGLYFMSKRYLYPLIAPPTPEKLEQDKAAVDEQFDKAFAMLEQLSKDTEALKESEVARTEKIDKVFDELDKFVRDSKSANRRQEDETEFLRDAVKKINTNIPKSMALNNEATENRLKDISNEVKSLKSLISQRLNAAAAAAATPSTTGPSPWYNSTSANLRPVASSPATVSPVTTPAVEVKENNTVNAGSSAADEAKSSTPAPAPSKQDYISSLGGRSSPFGSQIPVGKASIPAWQMAANGPKTPANAGSSTSPAESSS
ncbi:peroxisomal membrane anchor protein conserved region-domain-containing protein [Xylaria sp. CBS 124048]|nr:peroxisomal membrane anchor protein conserved region-domain-containing protein [Xylaria sp. CBS 124048]